MPSKPIPIAYTQEQLDKKAAKAEAKEKRVAKARDETRKLRNQLRAHGTNPRRFSDDSD